MRLALTAIGAVAASIGTLLALALVSLDGLELHVLEIAPPSENSAVSVEQTARYGGLLLACCIAGLAWASVVILPVFVVARRLISNAFTSKLVATVFVCILSAIALSTLRTTHDFLPVAILFLVGGVIGLAGAGIANWVLPSNKSPERSHER